MKDGINWGQRENHYSLTIRQKDKVKGYDVRFYSADNVWGISLGFFRTRKECKEKIREHMAMAGKSQ